MRYFDRILNPFDSDSPKFINFLVKNLRFLLFWISWVSTFLDSLNFINFLAKNLLFYSFEYFE